MTFFAVTASIMAVSILLIYKLCRYFGLELKWISLVLCAVFAFGVNGVTILLSPFLTPEHYVKLTVLVLVAAALVTLINEYLLKRDKRQQLATAEGAVMAMEELAEEAEEPAPAAQPALDEAQPAEAQPKKEEPPQAVPEARKTPIEPPARPQAATAEPGGALSQRLLEALKANEQPRTETAPQAGKAAEAAATETSAKEKPAEALIAEKKPAGEIPAETAPAKEDAPTKAAPTETAPAEAAEDTKGSASAEPEDSQAGDAGTEAEDAATAEEATPAAVKTETGSSQEEAAAATPDEPAEAGAQAEPAPPAPPKVPEETLSPEPIPTEAPEPKAAPAPMEEEPALLQDEYDATEAAVAELPTLDDLLDYAYSHKEKEPDAAIVAYRAAIDRYPEDSYAPFLIIELAGLYKERASYKEAINLYAESLGLPIIADDDAMVQEFSKTLRYLGTVQDILSKHHALATPFSKLTPEILSEIEAEFAKRQAK